MKETYWVSTGKLFNGRTTYIICDDDGLYATARGCDEAYDIADMLNERAERQAVAEKAIGDAIMPDFNWTGPDKMKVTEAKVTISGARFVQVEVTAKQD
jgi:hypothetical protein